LETDSESITVESHVVPIPLLIRTWRSLSAFFARQDRAASLGRMVTHISDAAEEGSILRCLSEPRLHQCGCLGSPPQHGQLARRVTIRRAWEDLDIETCDQGPRSDCWQLTGSTQA